MVLNRNRNIDYEIRILFFLFLLFFLVILYNFVPICLVIKRENHDKSELPLRFSSASLFLKHAPATGADRLHPGIRGAENIVPASEVHGYTLYRSTFSVSGWEFFLKSAVIHGT